MIGPFLNFIPLPGLSQGAISGAYVSVVCLLLPVRSDWSVPKLYPFTGSVAGCYFWFLRLRGVSSAAGTQ